MLFASPSRAKTPCSTNTDAHPTRSRREASARRRDVLPRMRRGSVARTLLLRTTFTCKIPCWVSEISVTVDRLPSAVMSVLEHARQARSPPSQRRNVRNDNFISGSGRQRSGASREGGGELSADGHQVAKPKTWPPGHLRVLLDWYDTPEEYPQMAIRLPGGHASCVAMWWPSGSSRTMGASKTREHRTPQWARPRRRSSRQEAIRRVTDQTNCRVPCRWQCGPGRDC
jgi:hypothetical protein